MSEAIAFFCGLIVMTIVWFIHDIKCNPYMRGYAEGVNDGIQDVNRMNDWIPCSERFPKIKETGVSRMVLLCWSDGQMTVGAYAGGNMFMGQAWPKAKGANVRVIAWMPLPEPYQEGEDE